MKGGGKGNNHVIPETSRTVIHGNLEISASGRNTNNNAHENDGESQKGKDETISAFEIGPGVVKGH